VRKLKIFLSHMMSTTACCKHGAANDAELSTVASLSETMSDDILSTAGVSESGEYNSCFYIPPPPHNVVRVYHNRKKTSYTDYPIDEMPSSTPTLTLIQLLTMEYAPSYAQVCKVAFAEGDATEDSCLADVLETTDMHGWTPLLLATQQRQTEAVVALLNLGANVHCQNPETGCTPLIVAVTAGDQVIVQHLLDHKASVNIFAGPERRNPLCEAIVSRRSDIMDMLLAAGGDIDLVNMHYPELAKAHIMFHKSTCERVCASGWMTGYWSLLAGYSWHTVMPASVAEIV